MSRIESLTTEQIRAEIEAVRTFTKAVRAVSSAVEYSRFTGLGYTRAMFKDYTFSAVDGWPLLSVENDPSTTSAFSPEEGEGGLYIARHTLQVAFTGTPPGSFAEMYVSTYYDTWSQINRVPLGAGYALGSAIECVNTITTPPHYLPGVSDADSSGYVWNYLYFGDETSTVDLPASKSIIELFQIKKQEDLSV